MSQKKSTPSGKSPVHKARPAAKRAGKGASAAKAPKPKAAKGAKARKDAPKPAPALPARSKAAGAPALPVAPDLKGLPTEEIWALYRKAIGGRPRDEVHIEKLRNVLMELHYPLVRHIAERLLQTLPKSIELEDLVSAG